MEKLELYKIRTFTELIGDTFVFVRQNFKSLFRGLFLIASPALLLAMIAGFFFWQGYFSLITFSASGEGIAPTRMLGIIPMYLCIFLASTLIVGVTFSYIKFYREDKEREISVSMLWQGCKEVFWKLIGWQLLVGAIIMLVFFMCIIIAYSISNGNSDVMVGIVFLELLVSIAPVIYFFVKFSFSQFFIVIGDSGVMESFSGSYNFTCGVFWKTLGFLLMLNIIVGVVQYIFFIPGYIFMIIAAIAGAINGMDNVLTWTFSALMSVGMSISYLCYSVMFVGQAIFYFSEIEKEQGIVANREIDEIGKRDE
jgi:hypothetical protein